MATTAKQIACSSWNPVSASDHSIDWTCNSGWLNLKDDLRRVAYDNDQSLPPDDISLTRLSLAQAG
jgi:hypothetical protein